MSEDKKKGLTPANTTNSTGKDLKIEEKKTVNVERDKLNALLDNNKILSERVERLESAASKAGLAKYDSMHEGKRRSNIKLISYDGNVVKSWSNMIKNKVEKNVQTKQWIEDQMIEVTFFELKEPMQLPYETFSQNYTKVDATVIKESINMGKDEEKYGNRTYVVKTKEGKEYTIGKKFVN